ncbi:hypothetical protein [Rhizobium sp. BK176]|uniref:hypothetical protein n=1 Tax=Rhizobium sp. BK176 TaxID=2587071 RepID=UPI00216969DA|nr:hypothetical protein [Rhizobium sp. BK176]MCS4089271.1 hypothetical protein [Rhizobium sp. BK176]
MKFLISGSAGRVGYADGQTFVYTDVESEPRQWLSTGIGMYAYALLHAEDVTEIDAETIEDALDRGRQEVDFAKALMMLNIIIDPKKLKLDDEITDWFLVHYETNAKPRIDAILRRAPLPAGVSVEALKAIIEAQPRLTEVINIIIETHSRKDAPTETEMAIDRERKLVSALKEVMSWVTNWDSRFLDDEEWPETENRVNAAITASEEFLKQFDHR